MAACGFSRGDPLRKVWQKIMNKWWKTLVTRTDRASRLARIKYYPFTLNFFWQVKLLVACNKRGSQMVTVNWSTSYCGQLHGIYTSDKTSLVIQAPFLGWWMLTTDAWYFVVGSNLPPWASYRNIINSVVKTVKSNLSLTLENVCQLDFTTPHMRVFVHIKDTIWLQNQFEWSEKRWRHAWQTVLINTFSSIVLWYIWRCISLCSMQYMPNTHCLAKVRLSLTFSRVGGRLDCKFELSKVTLPFKL